jgi:acyl-CoA synthetase (AMP-forming)/AMP-acid ligase II
VDFGTILRNAAITHSDAVAVWCDGKEQSYADLFERACRMAQGLKSFGLTPGDRVAMLGRNGLYVPEQIAGIALGGFVRAGLYAHESADVNAYLITLIEARVLIVHADAYPTLAPKLGDIASQEHVVLYGGERIHPTVDYESWLLAQPATDPMVTQSPDDIHVIRFSAGTTGRPKGIVHTVAGWLAIGDQYRWVTPMLDDRDVYLAAGQLTHAAVIFFWPILQVGGRIVVMPAFEPKRALELIETHRVTVTLVVPTMIQAIVESPDAGTRDLSSLRCVNYAASPIAPVTLSRAVEVFGDTLFHMYGQSEIVPITMLLPHQHRPNGDQRQRNRTRSVGTPTPNTEVTIVDEDGAALPPGTIGEIAVRSPGAMCGLWQDPDGTAKRFLPDGSVLTRDVGFLDEEGFLFLVDRKDDMIISGGFNIWPAQLEQAILQHAAVAEVCVVGAPHPRWGETPVAVVVLQDEAVVTAEELIELSRRAVGAVKKVTSVDFVDALPKSALGKVLRRELRMRYWTADEVVQVGGA